MLDNCPLNKRTNKKTKTKNRHDKRNTIKKWGITWNAIQHLFLVVLACGCLCVWESACVCGCLCVCVWVCMCVIWPGISRPIGRWFSVDPVVRKRCPLQLLQQQIVCIHWRTQGGVGKRGWPWRPTGWKCCALLSGENESMCPIGCPSCLSCLNECSISG